MGFWGNLIHGKKNAASAEKIVYSPLKGHVIPLSEVKDPVFSEGMMGPGVGIEPEDGNLCAPADGEITVAFPTGHAVALKTADGMEILIHIGIDTVKMNGDGFQCHVEEGRTVKAGEPLVSFDLQKIRSAGYDATTMVLVSNAAELGTMTEPANGSVHVGSRLYAIA
ncbi:MAG: PTS glucose transporter subunit IIA [Lachnospiraceae bacterium]|nr:PTS glucose transporter subunit IIA [Lachnospiraceae bacterium]